MYVLRKGLDIESYSEDGIGTRNPILGMGVDSYDIRSINVTFVFTTIDQYSLF